MARTSSKSKIVKSIPSSEVGMMECHTKSGGLGDEYIIARNQTTGQFTLWKRIDDGFEKVSTSKNPVDFDEIIPYEN